ncbi:hypothetical protein JW921_02070 [Candidatus Fermentibacterales bacterium]|nr:hypothetical protein [Candidatus Fermentibacterales bacterium]
MRPAGASFLRALSAALFLIACALPGDYDIEDVAPTSHLGEPCEHDHGHGELQEAGHEHHDDAERQESTQTGMHVHEAGQRNHGTEWFFNQPWASPFIWPKMLRDSLVLAALAAVIALVSRRLTRRA